MEGFASVLMATGWSGWWSLKVGWLLQFLRQQWGLLYWLTFAFMNTFSFHEWFLCSMQCCLTAFYLQDFFQNWSQSSETLTLLYQLSLGNVLYPWLSFQQSIKFAILYGNSSWHPMAPENNYNGNIKDHWSQVTITNIPIEIWSAARITKM